MSGRLYRSKLRISWSCDGVWILSSVFSKEILLVLEIFTFAAPISKRPVASSPRQYSRIQPSRKNDPPLIASKLPKYSRRKSVTLSGWVKSLCVAIPPSFSTSAAHLIDSGKDGSHTQIFVILSFILFSDPIENRTLVTWMKTKCPNHWTIGPCKTRLRSSHGKPIINSLCSSHGKPAFLAIQA